MKQEAAQKLAMDHTEVAQEEYEMKTKCGEKVWN